MDRAIVTIRQSALLAGDLAVFFLSLGLAVSIRAAAGGAGATFAAHLPPFSAIFAVWLVTFYAVGLYDLTLGRNRVTLIRQVGISIVLAAALAMAFFYLIPGIGIAPKTTLFLDLVITALLLLVWRLAYDRFLRGSRLRSRIVFVGLTDESRELIGQLKNNPHLGLDVVSAISLDGSDAPGAPVRRTLDNFAEYLKTENIGTVVLGLSPRTQSELAEELYRSIFLKVRFVDLVNFYEEITRRVPISAITRVWFLENLRESMKRLYEAVKRGFDILIALALGAVTLVLGPFIALGVWLTDRGPIFFHQERVGRDNRPFRIHKFRTMVIDAEKDGARFTEKQDARVTPLGRLLRATRLDEFPQFWNVLTGEMSFIGPRPERPEFSQALTADMPYYPMRLLVRPGLTGWAQINYPYYATPEEHRLKLQYDLYYVKNRSFVLDGVILLKTLSIVLRARGM